MRIRIIFLISGGGLTLLYEKYSWLVVKEIQDQQYKAHLLDIVILKYFLETKEQLMIETHGLKVKKINQPCIDLSILKYI